MLDYSSVTRTILNSETRFGKLLKDKVSIIFGITEGSGCSRMDFLNGDGMCVERPE